ncbi:SHRM1 protein, partial [Alcedo cyanopectus]|nr:SHRM1 protein [Ceyx cyanopectus]
AQPESPDQLQGARAGEEITRQTTPMLYYLSGGKTSSTLYPNKLTPWQEDSRSSPEEFAGSSCPSAGCLEMQRGSSWSRRSSAAGSPASSTEESSKEDYREKLKVAQKKVLRETSFKRKDLQMSLPTRLRQKPSKRPSIEHLRSLSLTSASEDAKPLPPSPLQLESLGSFSGVEEPKRPQTGRAGGRKRVTKEQKNLCYSEPEKLDQLAGRDVPWSQVRGEISEQDRGAGRGKALENRGRALSSSGISRTELKQIQHTALLQYMERKLHQRPGGGSQHLPLHKPPLQNRLAQPKWPPGNVSHPNWGRKMQSNDVFPEEKPPEVSPPQVCVPSRC